MSEITVRNAAFEDIPRICEIENACFSDPWSKGMFEDLLENTSGVCIVAVDGDAVVAFACAYIIDGEIDNLCGDAELADIAVAPDFRRRGIAKKLAYSLFERARGRYCSNMYLEVRESNLSARELYRLLGFIETGKRKNYYTVPREDAVLMKKELAAFAAR